MRHRTFHGLRRSTFALLAGLALLAAACGGDDTADTDTTPTETETTSTESETENETPTEEAGPRTVTVQMDGEVEDSNVAILGYLPRELTVRQGDTVDFALAPGDPHTVTFGTLVDDAFEAMANAEEGGPPPPEVQAVPQAFTPEGQVVPTGMVPCFSDSPPDDGSPCEQIEQPDFSGELAFYNSGGLAEPGATFTVPIAEDAAPGTYNYFCLIHGPDMSGTLTVVGADESAPTPEEVEQQREETLDALIEEAQPALDATSQGTQPGFEEAYPEGGDATVLAGGGAQPQGFIFDILTFGPDEVEIEAGQTVRWNIFGFHTISFNAPQDATPFVIQGDDGLPTVNELAVTPQGGAAGMPPPPEGGGGGGDAPPEATVVDGGAWDGQGFFSSGLFVSFPPGLFSYDITFETPGTYTYQCLIHPGMEGTVNVTG
ncbi:MAG: hypothetical protein R3343_10515 [Nitriliruptorales bacterium]|nr:hypothetical protein [Nitriliruptorales bacterium]